MIDQKRVLVWLQTTVRRDASTTIRSIERSDIKERFIVCTDRKKRVFPRDYADLQNWWDNTWREMLEVARVRDCEWILRLEDDVLVNRYILHNLCTWPATQHPKFAFGTLFMPDYWHRTPRIFRKEPDESCMYRDTKEVEGAQGQFVRVSSFERFLDGVPQARRDRGLAKPTNQPSFDWALSRAAWAYEKRVFVHSPALVDLHQESLQSKIDLPQHLGAPPADAHSHYWGHRAFNPEWRRGIYEYEQHDSLAPCVLTA